MHDLQSNYGGNSHKSMKVALEASLVNHQTSYIAIFSVLNWDQATSIPELMHGLNDLVALGKVLYLGISTTPAWIVGKPTSMHVRRVGRGCGSLPCTEESGMPPPPDETWNAMSFSCAGMRAWASALLIT